MFFYVFICLLIAVLSMSESANSKMKVVICNKKNSGRKIYYFICIMGTFALFLLRSKDVGGDLVNYERSFMEWNGMSFSNAVKLEYDLGFILLNRIIGKFSNSVYALMAVCAVIDIVLVFSTLKKYSANIAFSLFLYICLGRLAGGFSGLRQEVAISILFFSVRYIEKRDLKKFLFCWLLASSIHLTALIGILLYFTYTLRNDKKTFLFYSGLTIGCGVLSVVGIPLLVKIYRNTDYSERIVQGEGTKLFLFYFLICIFLCIGSKRVCKENKINAVLLNMVVMGTVLQILSFGFSLLTRITYYFMIGLVILIPNVIENIGNRQNRLLIRIGVILIAVLFFCYNLYNNSAGVIPYKLIE